ncbi:tripartite motif-containing protein 16-like [Synchiropus splendidus]|uniref:tripartite motif-containing protein 16-like n=1 Tax=Synchiropus splendidus TaxID=270530 RepID=UPI00237E8A54|nr:tripartite motif-containing protein 16-like [Synchiropus splendidus]
MKMFCGTDEHLLQQKENNIADKAVKESQETLQQLMQNLQKRKSDVEQQIKSWQETEAAQVQGLQEQLQQEIAELKKKDAELKQLSLIDSHLVFLHNLSSLSEVSEDTSSCRTPSHPHCYFEEVAAAVSASGVRLQDFVRDTWTNISLKLAPETKTRARFLRYSWDIALDPNTADSVLKLSKGNRKVTHMDEDECPLEDDESLHPDSFLDFHQVLSGVPLTGRCYWEVELREFFADVAVTYKTISRSGYEMCQLQSPVFVPPEWARTWITLRVSCPSTASLKP